LSESDVRLPKLFRQTVPQRWPGDGKTAVTELVAVCPCEKRYTDYHAASSAYYVLDCSFVKFVLHGETVSPSDYFVVYCGTEMTSLNA